MKKKILITGSSGYIGTNLFKYLKKKYDLFLIDKLKQVGKKKIQINLKNKIKLEKFFKKNNINTVIHLASETFDSPQNIVYNENIESSINLINLAKKYKVKQIIFASSMSIFEKNYKNLIKETEKPSAKNKYGLSKIFVEKELKKLKKINVTIFRLPIVIGQSRGHRMAILFELIRQNLPIFLIDNGKNKIQFVSIDELNYAIKKSIGLRGFNIFNIGCSKSYSFRENLEYIANKVQSRSRFISLNKYVGLNIINVLVFLKLIDIHYYHKSFLTQNILLNLSKIRKKLNFKSKISSRDLFYLNYKHYVNSLKLKTSRGSGMDKKPKLKIFNLLKFFKKI